jgi:hypothetical protein
VFVTTIAPWRTDTTTHSLRQLGAFSPTLGRIVNPPPMASIQVGHTPEFTISHRCCLRFTTTRLRTSTHAWIPRESFDVHIVSSDHLSSPDDLSVAGRPGHESSSVVVWRRHTPIGGNTRHSPAARMDAVAHCRIEVGD